LALLRRFSERRSGGMKRKALETFGLKKFNVSLGTDLSLIDKVSLRNRPATTFPPACRELALTTHIMSASLASECNEVKEYVCAHTLIISIAAESLTGL
jgi:hypothetical protein